jgi:predicted glycosyltransferase
MDDKIFKSYIINENGLKALYVEDLNIVIVSRLNSERIISDKKIKSIDKLLSKFKKAGIFRVRKASYTGAFFERREFDIKHSTILELLDEQGYEIRN